MSITKDQPFASLGLVEGVGVTCLILYIWSTDIRYYHILNHNHILKSLSR